MISLIGNNSLFLPAIMWEYFRGKAMYDVNALFG